jgi:hypothetical protein
MADARRIREMQEQVVARQHRIWPDSETGPIEYLYEQALRPTSGSRHCLQANAKQILNTARERAFDISARHQTGLQHYNTPRK